MPQAVEAACRDDLLAAGLSGQGALVHLLAVLRGAPETHLRLTEVARMAAETGLATNLSRHLDILVETGLLGRLPSTADEPVFDTVTERHSHLVYEDTAQIVDLDVSPETLLAILRQMLAEWPDGVEVMVRLREGRRIG
jgi:Fur family iron response transcriptional regulator